MVHLSLERASLYAPEAWNLYNALPPQAKDLTHQFFRSMDINCDGGVSWSELATFFNTQSSSSSSNSLVLPPFPHQLQYQLFIEIDQDRDRKLNFSEFILYFYCLFFRARCNQCHRDLLGDDYITCVDCFNYAVNEIGYATFDVCSLCNANGSFNHYHSKSRFKKYKDVIFSEMFMAATGSGCTNVMVHSGGTTTTTIGRGMVNSNEMGWKRGLFMGFVGIMANGVVAGITGGVIQSVGDPFCTTM